MPDTTIFYYSYHTPHGTVSLLPEPSGRYRVMFDKENLGSYHSASAAADDVSGGHTHTPSNGIDLGDLGIPDNIGEWDKKHFVTIDHLRPI